MKSLSFLFFFCFCFCMKAMASAEVPDILKFAKEEFYNEKNVIKTEPGKIPPFRPEFRQRLLGNEKLFRYYYTVFAFQRFMEKGNSDQVFAGKILKKFNRKEGEFLTKENTHVIMGKIYNIIQKEDLGKLKALFETPQAEAYFGQVINQTEKNL
jgi:hypothetical protein